LQYAVLQGGDINIKIDTALCGYGLENEEGVARIEDGCER
jgi:hypothetical protein